MDLNVMLRQTARSGLEAKLAQAVVDGDQEAAKKIAKEMSDLELQTAPKAPPYGDAEIRAELNKLPWFGVDPRKSAKAMQYGKDLDPRKFTTAEAFAKAVADAVAEDFKPVFETLPKDEEGNGEGEGEGEEGDGEGEGEGEDGKDKNKSSKPRKRTDGPDESDTDGSRPRRTAAGPWKKMSDAPPAVQAEIRRTATKLLGARATEDQRKVFEARALQGHYAAHQRGKQRK
jgi:hypothetical protein